MSGSDCGCERCDVPGEDAVLAFEDALTDVDEALASPAAREATERASMAAEDARRSRERHPASVEYRDAEVSYTTDGLGRLVAVAEVLTFDDRGAPVRLSPADFAAREGMTAEEFLADFREYLRDRDADAADAQAERLLDRAGAW